MSIFALWYHEKRQDIVVFRHFFFHFIIKKIVRETETDKKKYLRRHRIISAAYFLHSRVSIVSHSWEYGHDQLQLGIDAFLQRHHVGVRAVVGEPDHVGHGYVDAHRTAATFYCVDEFLDFIRKIIGFKKNILMIDRIFGLLA